MSDSDPDLPETEEDDAPSAAELEAAGQDSMFGGSEMGGGAEPEPAPSAQASSPSPEPAPKAAPASVAENDQPYRVLARKYRPQTFSQLIGQEPMVRTLANAIERDRLAHAFLMTGVRGVGKTSTARLIAKALNCVGPDGTGGPTIDPCGVCEYCTAIAEGRHIDVIEMDAASHTGVDDVREIIEQVRYAAVSARYKIYIIDEVHMLSRNAFNALLKTLEEPPQHVKFLFATTEVDKLPVTVLSRTQRFDLRRIPADLLADHFAHVCKEEGVAAEEEALRIIAAAAEGSVRDGLSILDQAIAHADMDEEGKVLAARVRDMLGLADKGAQRALLGAMLEGKASELIERIDEQYALGVEPLALMRSLMDLVHTITVSQVSGSEPDAPSEIERARLAEMRAGLSPAQLHRLWQLLLKGYQEVRDAPDPLVALQMALLRVLHASEMPDPGELARRLEELASKAPPALTDGASQANAPASAPSAEADAPPNSPSSAQPDWEQLVRQIDDAGHLHVAEMMRSRIRVIDIAPERLVYALADNFPDDPGPEIRDALFKVFGRRWNVEKGAGDAKPSLREQDEAEAKAGKERTLADPMVKAALAAFPDAELIETSDDEAVPQQSAEGSGASSSAPWN